MPVSEGLVLALREGYPVSRGHSLIVPRRHVGSFGEASLEEQSAMLAILRRVRAFLDTALRPDGYNIGINDGAAAGQTVMHVPRRVIPRHRGDRPDPGGKMRAGYAGSFRRRPTIGAAGANERSARRPGAARDLQHVQRIFDEGEFVATYKFALLIALVELAIEGGDDTGAPLDLDLHSIAEKLIAEEKGVRVNFLLATLLQRRSLPEN